MIKTLWITNPNGDVLELNLRSSDSDHGLLVFNIEGLGSPKATVNGMSGPNFDGVREVYVRTDARHIILTIAVSAVADAEEVARKKIYDFFPIKQEIVFAVESDTKDVYTNAIVESVDMSSFSKVENAVISLYCPEPYWLGLFEEKIQIPLNTEINIPYVGEIPTGIDMTIVLGGDVSDPIIITNDNGNQQMTIYLDSVTGLGQSGDRIYINTRAGYKSAFLERGTWFDVMWLTFNLVGGIPIQDDWIELRTGDNSIKVSTIVTPDTYMPDPVNLVAYFPLNEINGGDAIDRHNAKDLALYSGVVSEDWGTVYKTSRKFHRNDAGLFYTEVVDDDFCITDDFTITFWARMDNFSNNQVIMASMGELDGWVISASITGNLDLGIMKNGIQQNKTLPMEQIANVWAFYILWYDASAQTMYLQKNDGSPVSQGSVPPPNTYSEKTTLGGVINDLGGVDSVLSARLQSLAFYDTVLSADERAFYYKSFAGSGKGRTYGEVIGELEIDLRYHPLYQGV